MEAPEGLVSFEEVAVYFSEEEWRGLQSWQKELYREVMMDNIRTLSSVDPGAVRPEIILKILMGSVPYGDYVPRAAGAGPPVKPPPPPSPARRSPDKRETTRQLKSHHMRQEISADTLAQQSIVVYSIDTAESYGQNLGKEKSPNQCPEPEVSAELEVSPELEVRQEPLQCQETVGSPDPPVCQDSVQGVCQQETAECPEPAEGPQSSECPGPAVGDKPPTEETDSGNKLYICASCGETFDVWKYLVRHFIVHGGMKPYQCPDCGKCFTYPSKLSTHRKTHQRQKSHLCMECGRCFIHQSNLLLHQKIHSGEKPHACADCGKSFLYRSKLVAHQKTHAENKSHPCPDCGKSFGHKCKLALHQELHNGLKPFQCSVCKKGFPRKSSLIIHTRRHTGERPYVCHLCSRSFVEHAKLRRHIRVHTGEKPYQCSACGKLFNDSSTMNRHKRMHHGKQSVADPAKQRADAHHHPGIGHRIKTEEEEISQQRTPAQDGEWLSLPDLGLHIKPEKVEVPVSARRVDFQAAHRAFGETLRKPQDVRPKQVFRWSVNNQKVRAEEQLVLEDSGHHLQTHAEPVLKWTVSNQEVKTQEERVVPHQQGGANLQLHSEQVLKWSVRDQQLKEEPLLDYADHGELLDPQSKPAMKWTVNRLALNEQDVAQMHKGVQREYKLRCADCGQAFLTLSWYIKHRRLHRLERKQGLSLFSDGPAGPTLTTETLSDPTTICRDVVLKNLGLIRGDRAACVSEVAKGEGKLAAFHAFPYVPAIPSAADIQVVQLE